MLPQQQRREGAGGGGTIAAAAAADGGAAEPPPGHPLREALRGLQYAEWQLQAPDPIAPA